MTLRVERLAFARLTRLGFTCSITIISPFGLVIVTGCIGCFDCFHATLARGLGRSVWILAICLSFRLVVRVNGQGANLARPSENLPRLQGVTRAHYCFLIIERRKVVGSFYPLLIRATAKGSQEKQDRT